MWIVDDDILPIEPPKLPFGMDDKIFNTTDDEGSIIGEPYSMNDWNQKIKDISGVNEELYGREI